MRTSRSITAALSCLIAVTTTVGASIHAVSATGNTQKDTAISSLTRLVGTAPQWVAPSASRAEEGLITATVLMKQTANADEIEQLNSWLTQSGFTDLKQRPSIGAISFTGTRRTIEHAFRTTFVQQTISGTMAVAPATDLSVPESITAIESVSGLVQADAAKPTTTAVPEISDDCASYWGEKLSQTWPESVNVEYRSNALCGYDPAQLRAIHQLPDNATGEGATIAIVATFDDSSVEANTNTYFSSAGSQPLRNGQYSHHAPESPDESRCGGPSSWTTEQHLDVQAAHAIAPDANIAYWGADDCSTNSLYLRVLDAAEDTKTPDVISLSFGSSEELDTDADRTLLNRILVEAASRGISVFASTGNEGDYSNADDHDADINVASPASSPYVTAVGGTSTGLDDSNTIAVEAGWEIQTRFAHNGAIIPPGFMYGAGGGESKYYTRPTWQNNLSQSGSGRLLPDVSSLADPNTGFTTYSPVDGEPVYEAHGGTSLATPMVAATVAVAKAHTGVHIGLASPALYAMAGTSAIRDVRPASAATWYRRSADTGQLWLETLYMWDVKPQSLQSEQGWDPVTGLGVPTGTAFLDQFGAQQ